MNTVIFVGRGIELESNLFIAAPLAIVRAMDKICQISVVIFKGNSRSVDLEVNLIPSNSIFPETLSETLRVFQDIEHK